jgi:predicted RNA binding protein YcfA (HicA-like mRNA interferase family)
VKYRDFRKILNAEGFSQVRQKGSHRLFAGEVNGRRHLVTVARHSWNDDIHPKTLKSMVRQSGLPAAKFR